MTLTSTTPASGARIQSDWGREVTNSGWLGEGYDNTSGGQTTLANITNQFVPPAASTAGVTFTLNKRRRVKITVMCRYQPASTTQARGVLSAAWGTGSAIPQVQANINILSPSSSVQTSGTSGAPGSETAVCLGTVLLNAGTYTAFPAMQRFAGGSTSDVASGWYTLVEDVGSP